MHTNKSKGSSLKVQKKKAQSDPNVGSFKSDGQTGLEIDTSPHDTLTIKILSLRLADEDPKHFAIKVTYFDQLILTAIIKSIGAKDEELNRALAQGTLVYDPSDYEKMCLYADTPLVVNIQPLRSVDVNDGHSMKSQQNIIDSLAKTTSKYPVISCCNVDILSIFLGDEDGQKMCVKKRMEPMVTPSMMHRKSWDTLPLLTIELSVERQPENAMHHKVLKKANWMKLTLVAAYNMYIPYDDEYVYTAASKTPLYCDSQVGLVTYCQGYKEPRRFNCTNFFPKWESLRVGGDMFTKGDQKLNCKLQDIQNESNIDLPYYLNRIIPYHTAVWASFHRTLILKNTDRWLQRHIRKYKWPLEVHIYGESGGYSFMAFLNLFQLLYPGETTICLAVPLKWINSGLMKEQCGCDLLLTPNDRAPSTSEGIPSPSPSAPKPSKSSKATTESVATSMSTFAAAQWKATGADDNHAFVVVEVKLGRPLKNICIPPRILKDELSTMLTEMENQGPHKRVCTGRGQLERAWQNTVRYAASSLRKVPYYGKTEFCTFNRQLSETRTRVELTTSCWQDAAIFINNNFIIQQYLHSEDTFQELLMMSHACLMRTACQTLIEADTWRNIDPVLRAARHSRQMQDTYHAMELYMQLVVDNPRNADYWRELSTCLKDIDRDWAAACLNKSVVLDSRHPLTLLSKGATLFEEDPAAAEPFFSALLTYHPSWTPIWVIASAYYYERELYHLADTIMEITTNHLPGRVPEEFLFSRVWEWELGDWWDCTPLLPDMSPFFNAADLLLRLRAIPLAEVCLARALLETGNSAAYYHLVGLCCRLRGDFEEALCHLNLGLEKFGEISYLRSLEAECQHSLGNITNAMSSFDKAGNCVGGFSILMSMPIHDAQKSRNVLVDLVRRQPSAYGWTVFAEDWLKRMKTEEGAGDKDAAHTIEKSAAKSCAMASAIQAIKFDRRAGRAWALLGGLVTPNARKLHCFKMANLCGWEVTDEDIQKAVDPSIHWLCHTVGTALRECNCEMCDKMRM